VFLGNGCVLITNTRSFVVGDGLTFFWFLIDFMTASSAFLFGLLAFLVVVLALLLIMDPSPTKTSNPFATVVSLLLKPAFCFAVGDGLSLFDLFATEATLFLIAACFVFGPGLSSFCFLDEFVAASAAVAYCVDLSLINKFCNGVEPCVSIAVFIMDCFFLLCTFCTTSYVSYFFWIFYVHFVLWVYASFFESLRHLHAYALLLVFLIQ
jgi:hypothetical protein